MKKLLIILFFMVVAFEAKAETNYSEHIAPIIYKNCTSCHRVGEIGPMPFTSYNEVKAWGSMIKYVTTNKNMPPWPPERDYNKYVGQRALSQTDIDLIANWVDGGMPQGDPIKEPKLPTFSSGSQLGTPDLVLTMKESFTQKGNSEDTYRVFVLPTGLTEDKDISAIEVRPGNKKVVHHVLIATDSTGDARALDETSPEYGYEAAGGFGVSSIRPFVGYVPGASPTTYPDGIGYRLTKGSDLLIQMHYGPVSTDEVDSSTVNIYFAKKPLTRYMQDRVLLPPDLVDGPFIIPANKVKSFRAELNIPVDVTLFGVGPHGHLLNQSWEVFAINENGDTSRLVKIPKWNFNWQGAYNFEKPVVLKRKTKVIAIATYDNTTNNPYNPNEVPKVVSWGEKTTDEMFYLPLYFTFYQKGDENMLITNIENELIPEMNEEIIFTPNPVSNSLNFNLSTGLTDSKLEIYSTSGSKVFSNSLETAAAQTIDISQLAEGSYIAIIKSKEKKLSGKFVVKR